MGAFPVLPFIALLFATLLASGAQAQPGETSAPSPWAPSSAAAPSAPSPQPGYGTPVPFGHSPWWRYEQEKKSGGLAFLLEFFLPGAGSIYADHVPGAVITWALTVGGVMLILHSIHTIRGDEEAVLKVVVVDRDELTLGVLMALAGRTYGLVDSLVSTGDYNERLRRRLGLAAALRVVVIPTAQGGHAIAPALRLSF